MSIKGHATAVLALLGSSALAGCGAASPPKPARGDDVVAVIASVREELRTDRIVGAELRGSRLKVTLRRAAGPGDATISLWYAKLLAQAVTNRLAARGGPKVSSAVYVGASKTDLNGGPDRRLHAGSPASALAPGTCRRVARAWSEGAAARLTRVEQIDVLGGTCTYVLEPTDVAGFVADAGGVVSGLRAPGNPNARPSLITVVDDDGSLAFVLSWIPGLGGSIGQGSGWARPGLKSSAIVGQIEQIPPPAFP